MTDPLWILCANDIIETDTMHISINNSSIMGGKTINKANEINSVKKLTNKFHKKYEEYEEEDEEEDENDEENDEDGDNKISTKMLECMYAYNTTLTNTIHVNSHGINSYEMEQNNLIFDHKLVRESDIINNIWINITIDTSACDNIFKKYFIFNMIKKNYTGNIYLSTGKLGHYTHNKHNQYLYTHDNFYYSGHKDKLKGNRVPFYNILNKIGSKNTEKLVGIDATNWNKHMMIHPIKNNMKNIKDSYGTNELELELELKI